jgi:2-haloalkanoic acid dehalogenase type II
MDDLTDFRVLSFDCYGTLIDWEAGISEHLGAWIGPLRPDVSAGEVLRAFGRAEAIEEELSPTALYPEILERVHRRLASGWDVAPDPIAAARFAGSVGDWPAFADSHGALVALKKHFRLVILSNVDVRSMMASQERLGVAFDAVYTAEEIGSYKPDPSNFAHLIAAEERAGHSRSDILHVGQSLYHDHVPASSAGLATCWIKLPSRAGEHGATRPPEEDPVVDFRFSTMDELAHAVDEAFTT